MLASWGQCSVFVLELWHGQVNYFLDAIMGDASAAAPEEKRWGGFRHSRVVRARFRRNAPRGVGPKDIFATPTALFRAYNIAEPIYRGVFDAAAS